MPISYVITIISRKKKNRIKREKKQNTENRSIALIHVTLLSRYRTAATPAMRTIPSIALAPNLAAAASPVAGGEVAAGVSEGVSDSVDEDPLLVLVDMGVLVPVLLGVAVSLPIG